MAPPPAKRQKRLVVLSSDEEGEDRNITPTNHKRQIPIAASNATSNWNLGRSLPTRSRTKQTATVAQTKTNTSTRKPTRNPKAAPKKHPSKPIPTFFNVPNQPHHLSRRSPDPASPDVEEEVEDLIEDVSPNEELEEHRKSHNTTRAVLDRRKRPWEDKLPTGSQKFKLGGDAARAGEGKPRTGKEVDLRPWADRFGPNDLVELVVHKKKVSDVRNWLENVLQGRDRKRLLILKGPSGAGKTSTLSTLAKAMDFELSEWRNPVGSEYSSEGYLSMSAQFEEFIGRSGKFGGLDLTASDVRIFKSSSSDETERETRRKVILLEEFPNTFLSTSSALRSFRSSILEYLALSTPSLGSISAKKHVDNITPLVMVITETRLTTTTSARDSFTAHRLLGADILSHPGVSVVEFNPIAPTLLTKALDLVVQKEARQSRRRRVPGPTVLKRLGEVGDVRSAVGSLEFLCLRREDGDDWGGRVASKAKKGANTSSAITKLEKESLEMVTQRESSLGLFHAVGKVVYNKRDDAMKPLVQPPSHMPEHVRTRISQVSVEHLINETGTDTETFTAALHENYVLSCEGATFIDTINNCLEILSDSDVLGSPRGGRFGSSGDYGGRSFQGAASDSLRQDEICFQLAVRGLMFALPDPVKRRAHAVAGKHGGKNDTYKMFYPTSMRLSRQMEEIDGYVDRWIDKLRAGNVPFKQSATTGTKQFAQMKSKDRVSTSASVENNSQQPDYEDLQPMRTNLNCTKAELILERLPYITRIEQRIPTSSNLPELEKITQFHGIEVLNDNLTDDEDTDGPVPVAEWTTDRPAVVKTESAATLQQGVAQMGREVTTLVLPAEEEVEKMYLGDDDIED